MTVYVDEAYRCYGSPGEGRRAVETDDAAFDGRCIEGYRFVPAKETWTRADGTRFAGEMITPWLDRAQLAQCQAIYERMLAQQADMQAALDAIYTGVTE